jgi:hypothetical protein
MLIQSHADKEQLYILIVKKKYKIQKSWIW